MIVEKSMITGKNLCYKYTNTANAPDKPASMALDAINLDIKKGEFLAVLGRNGSGKSTLARHINALLAPTSGTLWVKGLDTSNPAHTWDIRQTAGMVFQNPDSQLIATIVEDDVAFGPENLGVPSKEIRMRVDEALASVNMADHVLSAPQFLSGGQKQRVAIAGVLAMKPDCIVLDEPTAMLDPSGRREVLNTVLKLNKESGITIILITHFMEEAVLAGRILVMDKGAVALDGSPREIFQNVPVLKDLGLDVPQSVMLSYELAQLGARFDEFPLTADEFIENAPFIKYFINKDNK